jgi:hypothetical protein
MRRSLLLPAFVFFVVASLVSSLSARAQDAQAPADQQKPAEPAAPAERAAPGAQAPAVRAKKGESADPNGTWKWERTFQDNKAEFVVRLNWADKKLTGKYSAFGATTDIEDGRFDKDELSFVAHREFNGNKLDVRFKGKVDGDQLRGTINVDFGNGPLDFEWVAKRTVDIDDVLGTWKLRIEGPQGVIEPQITITREGDALHGAYESPFGTRDAKALKLKNGVLSWEISGEINGGQFKVAYSGKPRGNAIAGKAAFDFGGNTGEMDFTGQRTPPKEESKEAKAAPAGAASSADKPADETKRPPLEDEPKSSN